ncbi:MAG: hypothetical protein AAGG50_05135 [Bacteroidota bacterium]
MSTDAPKKPTSQPIPYQIPPEGSLGLLALGYRGIEAWRAVRGTDWIEERRQQAEAERAAQQAEAKASTDEAATDSASAQTVPVSFDGLSVVVVSGLPRSGTSMLMQMLTAGGLTAFTDGAREADTSNPRGYYEHERVKALVRDKAWLPDADGHVVKIVAPLLPHLPPGPRYRVVLLERDLHQVLRSQAAMLEREGRPVADETVLRNAYARHLALAKAWAERQPSADLLVLGHADVIADPAAAAAQLAHFLKDSLRSEKDAPQALDVAAMAGVVDPSLHRQRSA